MLSAGRVFACSLIAWLLVAGAPALAQDAFTSQNAASRASAPRPYIDPYRESATVNLVVFGDSLASGLAEALAGLFSGEANIKVIENTRPASGFTRPDYFDWNENLSEFLSRTRVDAAIVLLGINDNQSLRTSGARFKRDSDRWRQGYSKRLAQFIRQLKRHGAAIYWMGLPVSSKSELNAHFRDVNELLEEQARLHQIKFIETWKPFAGPDGGYTSEGTDITGRPKRMRSSNGLGFTDEGYDKMARLVAPEFKADLTRANAERNVELVGRDDITLDGVTSSPVLPDNALIESETRPSETLISASDGIDDDAATPTLAVAGSNDDADSAATEAARAVERARQAAIKALLRGEALAAKPGRADDFNWPEQ